MSDYSAESSDEEFDFQEEVDPLVQYDSRIQQVYSIPVTEGRYVLSLVQGNFNRAYDTLDRARDLQDYLTSIGAIRAPNIDMHALYDFCVNPIAYQPFEHSNFISDLPYAIISQYNLAFVVNARNFPICEQDAQVNAVCAQSQDPRICYEEQLGLTQQANTNSSVVLSKQLMRFLCRNVNNLLYGAYTLGMNTIHTTIYSNWYRFREIIGQNKLDYVQIDVITQPVAMIPQLNLRISKQDHIEMLKNELHLTDSMARDNTTAETFIPYVKRRTKNELIQRNSRLLEKAVMSNNRLVFQITLGRF